MKKITGKRKRSAQKNDVNQMIFTHNCAARPSF